MRDGHLVLHEQRLAPGTEWAPKQPGWLFLRIQAGEGYLWLDATPRPLPEGAVVVSPRAPLCRLRASQLGELRTHHFQVVPDLIPGLLSSLDRQRLDQLGQKVLTSPRVYAADHELARQFSALNQAHAAGDALVLRCQMLHLVGLLLREAPAATPAREYAVTARDRFQQLIAQMPEADLQHETPASLAKRCGCSVRHFSRLFRSQFGHSFVPKKTELKLHKARQLLVETDAKVIDVALDSGFQHVGLFTTLFKKQFGMTPSVYRRRNRR